MSSVPFHFFLHLFCSSFFVFPSSFPCRSYSLLVDAGVRRRSRADVSTVSHLARLCICCSFRLSSSLLNKCDENSSSSSSCKSSFPSYFSFFFLFFSFFLASSSSFTCGISCLLFNIRSLTSTNRTSKCACTYSAFLVKYL